MKPYKEYPKIKWIKKETIFDVFGTPMIIKYGDIGKLIWHEYKNQYLIEYQGNRFYSHEHQDFEVITNGQDIT